MHFISTRRQEHYVNSESIQHALIVDRSFAPICVVVRLGRVTNLVE